jgi:protein-S-isoprenylcysteine O-methyltransferase Ste14
MRILSLAGWSLTVWATFQIDHFDRFGLKKPSCALRGIHAIEKQFVVPFLHRYMRHPIQTRVLIGMWSQATMSQGKLLLTATMTAYIFTGLFYEERDLVSQFGNRYSTYLSTDSTLTSTSVGAIENVRLSGNTSPYSHTIINR